MYSVYRVPLYRCSDTITLSARSSRDDAPGGVQPTGTECRQTEAGLVKSWSCTSCAFIPISLRPFPPLAKGGLGGVVPARPVTRSSHALSLSPFASLSRGEKNRSRFPRLPHHPPLPPLRKGGKGIARSRRHSIARNKNTRLETVPPARSRPTLQHASSARAA